MPVKRGRSRQVERQIGERTLLGIAGAGNVSIRATAEATLKHDPYRVAVAPKGMSPGRVIPPARIADVSSVVNTEVVHMVARNVAGRARVRVLVGVRVACVMDHDVALARGIPVVILDLQGRSVPGPIGWIRDHVVRRSSVSIGGGRLPAIRTGCAVVILVVSRPHPGNRKYNG